jgi:hypothetical protein
MKIKMFVTKIFIMVLMLNGVLHILPRFIDFEDSIVLDFLIAILCALTLDVFSYFTKEYSTTKEV